MGLVGLCLGWGANQWMVWALEKQAEQWGPAPVPKILPRHTQAEPAGPVEFAPGIIQERVLPADEDGWAEESPDSDAPGQNPPAPSEASASKDATPGETPAEKKTPARKPATPAPKPAVATRVFTADREALRTQFKRPTDLYAHGHYLPNEENGVRRGLRFAEVASGGVFASLGIQKGDIVLSVNGAPLNSQNDVLANFENMRKMDVLNFRLERDGKPLKYRYILK